MYSVAAHFQGLPILGWLAMLIWFAFELLFLGR